MWNVIIIIISIVVVALMMLEKTVKRWLNRDVLQWSVELGGKYIIHKAISWHHSCNS